MASTYTVQKGDTIQSIAKKLGMKDWKALWNANRATLQANYAKTGNYLLRGKDISTKLGGSTGYSVKTTTTPSQKIAKGIAKNDFSRAGFEKKYGTEQQLRPEAAFLQVAEQQVNPEAIRNARKQVGAYDMGLSQSGAYRTGAGMKERQGVVDQLERERKTMVNQYLQQQNDLFSRWYNKELEAYGTSKNPTKFTLSKFGVNIPGLDQTQYTPKKNSGYNYNTPFQYNNMFGYGAYGNNAVPMYGTITPK